MTSTTANTGSTVLADTGKWLTSTFYREAVENVVHYNSQLLKDRKSRLPYVDAQTGIAQSINSHLLRSRLERRRGVLPGQIYSYPPYRWRQESKPAVLMKKDTLLEPVAVQRGASPAGGLIQTVEGGVLTKRSSRLAGMVRSKDPASDGVILPVVPRVPLESPASSELNEEEESPDADYDLDDYDSEEEKRKKKRRPPPKSSKSSGATPARTTRSSDAANDKPFLCTACNRRYKTAASLKAHRTQYHGGQPTSSRGGTPATPPLSRSSSEARIPVPLPPPPNLIGKEDAKPNPYCDFCLGEDHMNNKTKQPEKMVSCANCGRSAHPSCMQFSESLAQIVCTYRWQCIECKSCHFCGTSENDDQLLFCDDCDRGYHMYCLKPPLKEPPEGNWSCGMCYRP